MWSLNTTVLCFYVANVSIYGIISNLSGCQPFQLWREVDAALHTLFPDKNHDQQQTCSAPPETISK